MHVFATFLLFLVFMLPKDAHTGNQEPPSVAILPLKDAAGKKASAALLESLGATKQVSIISLSKTEVALGTRSVSASDSSITDAQKNLDAGRKAYDALDFKKAQTLLSSAKKQFRQLSHQEEAFEGLRATQIQLALLYLANKQTELAQKELNEMYVGDPEREERTLSEKQYPPEIRKLYEVVQEKYKGKLNATLAVETNPEGAVIYIDGKMIGPAPASVMRLPAGTHYIYANLEGYEPQLTTKGVVGGNNEISLTLSKSAGMQGELRPVKSKDDIDHQQIAFLDTVANKLKADIFIFLAPGRGEISAQLYDQRSQEVSKIVTGKSPDELAKKLTALINESGYVVAAIEGTEEEEPVNKIINPKIRESQLAQARANAPTPKQYTDKPSIWSSPWFWGSIGAVALVGVGGWFAYDRFLKDDSTTTLTLPIPGR